MIPPRSALVLSDRNSSSWRLSIRAAILLLLASSPALVRAQFQAPTPEELNMAADPKAPDASAVYLYYAEDTDAPNRTKTVYERIKVLTEAGKDLATVSVPYEHGVDKVAGIEGRTIHSDGSVLPLTAKPSDLVEVKTKGYQLNSVVFTLPSVEVGSILEFRIKLRRDEDWTYLPSWEVQRKYFTHQAHFSFMPGDLPRFHNLMYTSHVGPVAKVVLIKNVATLDISDVPPEPDDDWMPPLNTLRWRVEFFSNRFSGTQEFWEATRKRWAGWIEEFIKPTNPIKQAVAGIVASGDTDEQKAIKIYAAVQKLDNTDFSRTKSGAERKKEKLKEIVKAEDVWKNQSGSANDISLLYASMARAAGLKVWPAYVVNRNRAMFDISYLSDGQFDDDIVLLNLGGKTIYLDPGQKMCPFGSLHWKHTLTAGFRLTDKGADFLTTPAIEFKFSKVSRSADLTVSETGDVQGSVQIVMSGPEALSWRQLALENDQEEVKKQFNESLHTSLPDGTQADFDHFLALDDYESNLFAIVKVSGNIGSATGKHFFLPGLFFESRAKHPFVLQDKRTIPIDIHFPLIEQDQVTYHLPPGFKLDSMPQETKTPWANHAVLSIHCATEGDSVTVSRVLARNFTLLNPNDYSDLRAFYMKVASNDQQQLVLTRASESKGN